MTLSQARRNVGELSEPGKMAGYAWSIPIARGCHVGRVLARNPDSVCASCYAGRGRYNQPNVITALERRYQAWRSNRELWRESMITILHSRAITRTGLFRWFDSGDISSQDMIEDIFAVARATPNIKHWLPTKEYARALKNQAEVPANVTMRVSHPMRDRVEPGMLGRYANSSAVLSAETFDARTEPGYHCPASAQGGKCHGADDGGIDCDACYDSRVQLVHYRSH